jgi:hypothetical protein
MYGFLSWFGTNVVKENEPKVNPYNFQSRRAVAMIYMLLATVFYLFFLKYKFHSVIKT